VDRRDVKDKDEDLTHEPEQIKAYRDTWKLGIHSYLTYVRDRFLVARELLTESGSIFVQINDENFHLVRSLMDEVFGRENFCGIIPFSKTGGLSGLLLDTVLDYLLWYGKKKDSVKYRQPFFEREPGRGGATGYILLDSPDGESFRQMTKEEQESPSTIPKGWKIFDGTPIISQGYSQKTWFDLNFQGSNYTPPKNRHWSTGKDGLNRLVNAGRLIRIGSRLEFKRYFDDFPATKLTNIWLGTGERGFTGEKLYTVQTATTIIERCILMTTDPGDLVLDITCGSGTTAYCAEKWGRRWITCDTSRVALAIARQRLMTARYDYYELLDSTRGPAGGFIYETVPHITLESIAHNTEIDTIAAKYQAKIDEALSELNNVLGTNWKEWEVPRELEIQNEKFKIQNVKKAHELFWSLKRKKRKEIDESIQRYAPQETLYDRPHIKRGVVRVSGPFSVEAIPVPAIEDPSQIPIPQYEDVGADLVSARQGRISDRGGDYLTTMVNLLKQQGGVLFPGGKRMELQNLRLLNIGMLHAEAETKQNGKKGRVAISFGPQYGPVTATQTNEAIQTAKLNAYDALILAGFSFEAEAQAFIQKAGEVVKGMSIHFANISPDVLVGDLLKTTRASQIFTVFGQPDVKLEKQKDGTYIVELRGVDIYDPITGETHHSSGSDVAAWFLDTDYDGMTFHISRAFFPGDSDAWDSFFPIQVRRAQADCPKGDRFQRK
jgi:adenine-specific DNA-methyltransferase